MSTNTPITTRDDTLGVVPRATRPQLRRPRLLLVITLAETGGAQSYVAALLPALTPHFDVVVAAHGEGPLVDAAARAGVRFVALRHMCRALHPVRDALGLLELVTLIRRERPDIVHANSSKAGILGRLAAMVAGVPITVFTVHGWAFKAYGGLAARLYRTADRVVARATTITICVTDSERATGLDAGTCVAKRTTVIPNAIDLRTAPRARHASEPPRIITVGRLAWPKDPQTLLDALGRLRPRTFAAVIVGDGPQRPDAEARIRELGLASSVQILGARDDVPDLLAQSDVFVLASRSEGGPISILEAMAAGLPVVASAVGGVGELVADGATGLLAPAGDAGALAAAVQRLLDDPELRHRMGEAGRRRAAERFDIGAQRSAHLDLYARELARHGALSLMP